MTLTSIPCGTCGIIVIEKKCYSVHSVIELLAYTQWSFTKKIMNRNFFCPVIILSSRQFGEDNRIFTVLTQEYGVFDAVLYGGRKSKLRSVCSPYHYGTMWFYRDEKRNSIKITDFDVTEYHLPIRESLYKTYAAALCSELVIKTKNGHHQDELATLWVLVKGFLDGLGFAKDEEAKVGLVRFLWRFLVFLGYAPNPHSCSICGGELKTVVSYSSYASGFVCQNCKQEDCYNFTDEAINYLQILCTESPAEVRKAIIHENSLQNLKEFLFEELQKNTGLRFQTIESGISIL